MLDNLGVLDGNGRGTVKDDGESGDTLLDLGENVEPELRRNEDSVGVAGALFGLEFGGAVAGSDGDREGIHAGFFNEVFDFFGLGVIAVLVGNLVLNAGENAEFAFHGNAMSYNFV